MILQNVVWIIALVGMGLVALGFIHVILQAGKPADDAATRKAARTSNILRRWLFGALLIIFLGGTYATLHHFPVPLQHTPLGIGKAMTDFLARAQPDLNRGGGNGVE